MNSEAEAPLIVDCVSDLPLIAQGWVFVRESSAMYVEQNGTWVVYVKPPPPSLWSLLEDDS